MSLRKLPKIVALDVAAVKNWQMREDAIDSWNPNVKAVNGDNSTTITMLDVVGEDHWTDEGVTAKRVGSELRAIGDQDIIVELNSPGGDFFEGVAIYNMLREHKGRVTVKIIGIAASAASVIAMAGDDIQIGEAGFLMIHNAWTVSVGNRHDMQASADTLEPFDKAMADVYAKQAGVSTEIASEWMDKESYFNGTEAVKLGLATSLLESDEIQDEEGANAADTKSVRASMMLENALRAQNPNMTRSERRALLADVKGGKPSAAVTVTPCADDITASLLSLAESIK